MVSDGFFEGEPDEVGCECELSGFLAPFKLAFGAVRSGGRGRELFTRTGGSSTRFVDTAWVVGCCMTFAMDPEDWRTEA